MSVDTNVKGKNLAPYRRMHTDDDLKILVTPRLAGLASRMVITTSGTFRKKLTVQLAGDGNDNGAACELDV